MLIRTLPHSARLAKRRQDAKDAALALAQITGVDFSTDRAAWEAWYHAQHGGRQSRGRRDTRHTEQQQATPNEEVDNSPDTPPPAQTGKSARSIRVTIDSVVHSPSWINGDIAAQATVVMDSSDGESVEDNVRRGAQYRWKWEFLADGAVSSVSPQRSFQPRSSGWTQWSLETVSNVTGSFPSPGAKQLEVTVQVRMAPTGQPAKDVLQSRMSMKVEVLDLEDATGFRLVDRNIGQLTFSWIPSRNPNVTGYKYHIEPDKETLYDVGNVSQVTIKGLTPGKKFGIGLHAYDAKGNITK